LKLTGEGGLMGKLTKMVVESALEGELDDHLGYGKNDPSGRDGGNSRNGHRAKTVLTDTGPVEISVPRDRDSSFEPKMIAKRQRRLAGEDEMVISVSAKGLTHGEISAHLAEVSGAEVSMQTITAITDRVMEGMAGWQSRPLDPGRFLANVANHRRAFWPGAESGLASGRRQRRRLPRPARRRRARGGRTADPG
jgi:putative transposase